MPAYKPPKKLKPPTFFELILAAEAIRSRPDAAVKELSRLRLLHRSKLGKSDTACRAYLERYQKGGYWYRDVDKKGLTYYDLSRNGAEALARFKMSSGWEPDTPFSYRPTPSYTPKAKPLYMPPREKATWGEGLTAPPETFTPKVSDLHPPTPGKMDFLRLDQVFASYPIEGAPVEVPESFTPDRAWRGGRFIYKVPGRYHIALQGNHAIIRPSGETTGGDIERAVGAVSLRLVEAVEYLTGQGYKLGPVRKLGFDREASSDFMRELGRIMPAGVTVAKTSEGEINFGRSDTGQGEVGSREAGVAVLQDLVEMRESVRVLREAFRDLAGLMVERLQAEIEREKLESAKVLRSLGPKG